MTDIEWADLLIRTSVSLTMVSFGLYQITNPKQWQEYLPPWLHKIILAPVTFMQVHGLINLSLGLTFGLNSWPDAMTWIVLGWWLSILPFAFYVKWTIGMRDLAIIAALAALIVLP
jgi:hypothetical protein